MPLTWAMLRLRRALRLGAERAVDVVQRYADAPAPPPPPSEQPAHTDRERASDPRDGGHR